MADLRCTINDMSVPHYARMHCYDLAQFKETGRLLCPCGHEGEVPAMPDITLLIGAQDALRAGNATDTMRHISNFLVQSGCTGAIDEIDGTLSHDGDTCPIHEAPIYMVGTEVHHYPGDEDDPAGYVAFARLSDGTLSFPMGSTVRTTPEEAGHDCARVRYKDGHVYIEQPNEGGTP